jgi:type IV secretory pathway VirB2 component (pilin)
MHPGELASAGPLVAAVQWLEATLLGTVATTVAVIAIAWTGMMMLGGRIDWRRGVTTVVGCFLVFGATSIAAGIRYAADAGSDSAGLDRLEPAPIPVSPLPTPTPRTPMPVDRDPYAGASMQLR